MIEYNPITPDVLEALREISGKRVITGEDINPDYTHDDMPIYGIGMPEATIDVESTEEIAAIMSCATNITSRSPSGAPAPAWQAEPLRSSGAWCCAPPG